MSDRIRYYNLLGRWLKQNRVPLVYMTGDTMRRILRTHHPAIGEITIHRNPLHVNDLNNRHEWRVVWISSHAIHSRDCIGGYQHCCCCEERWQWHTFEKNEITRRHQKTILQSHGRFSRANHKERTLNDVLVEVSLSLLSIQNKTTTASQLRQLYSDEWIARALRSFAMAKMRADDLLTKVTPYF